MPLDHVIDAALVRSQLLDGDDGARAQLVQHPGRFADGDCIIDGKAQHGGRAIEVWTESPQVVHREEVQAGAPHRGTDPFDQTRLRHDDGLGVEAEGHGPGQRRRAHRPVGLPDDQLESRIGAAGGDDDGVAGVDALPETLGGEESGRLAVEPSRRLVELVDDAVSVVGGDDPIHALRDARDESRALLVHADAPICRS